METQPTKTTCAGITKAKTPCSRSSNLDENGFCHQHADQAHHVGDRNARPRHNPVPDSPPSPKDSNGNNNNDPPSSDPPPSPSEEHAHHHQDFEFDKEEDAPPLRSSLPQCSAISHSTRSRCRHLVSFAGEQFCPSHGGKQKAPLPPELPQCQAIAKNTRKQCSKHVSVAGEQFCPAHGGLAKGQRVVVTKATAAPTATRTPKMDTKEMDASIPWRSICSVILKYVVEEHPVQCGCSAVGPAGDGARRCQTMQTIRLLLSLASSDDDATSAEDDAAPSHSHLASASHWATQLSEQGQLSSTSIWLLGLYQLVTTTRGAAFATRRRATTPPAHNFAPPPSPPPTAAAQSAQPPPSPIPSSSFPSSGSFRLPSDLDSFLQEFIPLSQEQSRRAGPQPMSSPPAPF